MKSKPEPKTILLDQYHLDIYIRPTCTLTKQDKQKIKRHMKRFLGLLSLAVIAELDNKIKVEFSQ